MKKIIISVFSLIIACGTCNLSVSAAFNDNFAMNIADDFAMDNILTQSDYAIDHSDGVFDDNMYVLNDLNEINDALFFGNDNAVSFMDTGNDSGVLYAINEQGDWSAEFNDFYSGDFNFTDNIVDFGTVTDMETPMELASAEIFTDTDIMVAADSLSLPDPLAMSGVQDNMVTEATFPEFYITEVDTAANVQDMVNDITNSFDIAIAAPDPMLEAEPPVPGEKDDGELIVGYFDFDKVHGGDSDNGSGNSGGNSDGDGGE